MKLKFLKKIYVFNHKYEIFVQLGHKIIKNLILGCKF